MLACVVPIQAQRLIEYEAGMGSRDPQNADTWVLYRRVKAMHEGMKLYADSALLNTKANDFTAFRNIKIRLSDTTTIYGDRLIYSGNTRIVDIWGDTVTFIDGHTVLKTDRLSFDRNTGVASYDHWGHSTNKSDTLDSRQGRYDSNVKAFYIYNDVVLRDSASHLETDTLVYNTRTETAEFLCPTRIYSDSTTIFSDQGFYNSASQYAVSFKNSRVRSGEKTLDCDTLHYYENEQRGKAFGNVVIFDSLNNVICYGQYGESNQKERYSLVSDSALVIFVDKGDSLFLHADTVYTTNNADQEFETILAHHHVKVYRNDAQAMCDSMAYSAPDSLISLYYNPVLWYDSFQCTADTMDIFVDSAGVRLAWLKGNSMAVERIDAEKFNQVKGHRTNVYFTKGDPNYADVLGSAQMVYYIIEEDTIGRKSLVGVNAGVGSDMKIVFTDREPTRVITFGQPDMHAYPLNKLPQELRNLPGFEWRMADRPKSPKDVFDRADHHVKDK